MYMHVQVVKVKLARQVFEIYNTVIPIDDARAALLETQGQIPLGSLKKNSSAAT